MNLRGLEIVMDCMFATAARVRARAVLVVALLMLMLGGALVLAQPQSAQAATQKLVTVNVVGTCQQTEARKGLDLVNELRTGSNAWYWNSDDKTKTNLVGKLSVLKYDYKLEAIAMQRAAEIAVYWGHERPNGTSCFTAYEGYASGAKAENIAIGYQSVESVITGWAEENENYAGQGHRRNMLWASATHIGIACVKVNGVMCWVQEFGNADSGMAASAANDSVTSFAMELDANNATFSLGASSGSVSVVAGESAVLPSSAEYVTYAGSWPSGHKIPVENMGVAAWKSSNSSVAAVADGKVTGVAAGTATLTAYLDEACAIQLGTVSVQVTEPAGKDEATDTDTPSSGDTDTDKPDSGDTGDTDNEPIITELSTKNATYKIGYNGNLTLVALKKNVKTFTLPGAVQATVEGYDIYGDVTGIKASAFKSCKKLKTLVIKSSCLTKKGVKNALKGSSVKTIKVKVSSKKSVNKRYIKLYKKCFAKANSGKKVTVK